MSHLRRSIAALGRAARAMRNPSGAADRDKIAWNPNDHGGWDGADSRGRLWRIGYVAVPGVRGRKVYEVNLYDDARAVYRTAKDDNDTGWYGSGALAKAAAERMAAADVRTRAARVACPGSGAPVDASGGLPDRAECRRCGRSIAVDRRMGAIANHWKNYDVHAAKSNSTLLCGAEPADQPIVYEDDSAEELRRVTCTGCRARLR